MLRWTLIFFVFSLIAGVFGFGGLSHASQDIAKILFFVFIVLFLFSMLGGLIKGGGKSLSKWS